MTFDTRKSGKLKLKSLASVKKTHTMEIMNLILISIIYRVAIGASSVTLRTDEY